MNDYILNETKSKINFLIYIIDKIEIIVQKLADEQPRPVKIVENEITVYDYKDDDKKENLAVFLKIFRLLRLARANVALLNLGLINESFQLLRSMQEEEEDIYFLCFSTLDKNSNLKESLLKTFFCTNLDKNFVRRRDIQKAISVNLGDNKNLDPMKKLYDFYSCSTHSNCRHIVNGSYDDQEGKYNTKGSISSIEIATDNFFDQLYRTTVSLELYCSKFQYNTLQEAQGLRKYYEKR